MHGVLASFANTLSSAFPAPDLAVARTHDVPPDLSLTTLQTLSPFGSVRLPLHVRRGTVPLGCSVRIGNTSPARQAREKVRIERKREGY
jgi:hypothetical protein